jgi:hypothetical protein
MEVFVKNYTKKLTGLAFFISLAGGNALAADPTIINAPTVIDEPEGYSKVGFLSCRSEGGYGYIVGSSKLLTCVFEDFQGHRDLETYHGRINKLGADIGYTGKTALVWAVYSPTRHNREVKLDGIYLGLSLEASLGVGAGANILVGGFKRGINLMPLSLSTQLGLNIAGGIGAITLVSN